MTDKFVFFKNLYSFLLPLLNPSIEDFGYQSSSKLDQPFIDAQQPNPPFQKSKPSSSKNEDASNNKPTTISAELSSSNQDDIVKKLLQNTQAELKNLKTDVNQYFNILKSQNLENGKSSKSLSKYEESSIQDYNSTPEVDEYFKILKEHIPEKDEPSKFKKDPKEKDKLTPRSKTSTPRTPSSSRNVGNKPVVPNRREDLKPVSVNQRKNFDIPEKSNSSKKSSAENLSQKKYVQRRKQKESFSFILEDISEEDKSRSTSRETTPTKHGNIKIVQTDLEPLPLLNSTFNNIQDPPNTPNSFLNKSETNYESPEKQEITPEKPKIKETNLICKESSEFLEVIESFYSGKKKQLSVQTLPAVDIRRPLITQKMPDVIIQPSYIATDQEETIKYDNVKYLELTHEDVNQPKEIPKTLVRTVETEELQDKFYTSEEMKHEVTNNVNPEEDINEIEEQAGNILDDSQHKNKTIREELNLNVDDIPSVRTLKDIQYYLEQRCALIRKRLDDERDLKPGECISLRWKLNQPPRWQTTSSVTENDIEVESDNTPISKFAVPNIIYDKISTKNAQESVTYDTSKLIPPSNIKGKRIVKKTNAEIVTDKGTQHSLDSINIESEKEIIVTKYEEITNRIPCIPVRKLKLHAITNQLSIPGVSKSNEDAEIQTSDLQVKVKESGTQFSPQNSNKICYPNLRDILDETKIRTFESTVKESATQSSPEKKIEKQKSIEQSVTQTINLQPIFKDVKDSATQCAEKKKLIEKAEIQTMDLQPVIITETATQYSPKIEKEAFQKAVTFKESSTQKDESPKKNMKTVGLGVTENELKSTESEDKCISCNLSEFVDSKKIQQTRTGQLNKLASSIDSCAVFSSAGKLNIDNYRRSRSPERSDVRSIFKRDSSSESSSLKINKLKCKRLQQKYRKSSTPIISSSTCTTENNFDDISLSEGEVRLPCECSTSIGEIHLCHYANNIRKKVRTLKQNPEKVLKETVDSSDLNAYYKYKHYDNWVTYYVTKSNKSVSSGEIGTHSNLSSITSISPSD